MLATVRVLGGKGGIIARIELRDMLEKLSALENRHWRVEMLVQLAGPEVAEIIRHSPKSN